MRIKAGLFVILFFLSIVISVAVSLSAPLISDELGALKNIFVPFIVGCLTIVLLLLSYLFFRKKSLNLFVLLTLVAINLLTGIYLRISFKPFLQHGPDNEGEYNFDITRMHSDKHVCADEICYQNTDGFPDNDHLVLSYVYVPPGSVKPTVPAEKANLNHNNVAVRVDNNSDKELKIVNASFSDDGLWELSIPNKSTFPLTVPAHQFANIAVTFTGEKIEQRIASVLWKTLMKLQYSMIGLGKNIKYQLPVAATAIKINGVLTLNTNNEAKPVKKIYLNSLWQYRTESDWEPDVQKQLDLLGFKTRVKFRNFDNGIKGKNLVPSSDEIKCAYFKIANPSLPVNIRKLAAYHGCCALEDADDLTYYYKGQNDIQTLLKYSEQSGQMLLPKPQNLDASIAQFYPLKEFGLKIGNSHLDNTKNFAHKIGIRVWKAISANGKVLPNTYLIGSDYLGTKGTNYDYQDNVYYVTNVLPDNQ
ncbi:MAG: hypothetical protein JKY70_16100 [Mucilaginibacter sp.]|nr:hypothetical protein [Mucilaginibacter sp.]